ncbi:MAG: trigger factor [Mesotoga sp.]|jgi:trigger factor|uniref:trigger factor n=1 Tax=Mesotoga sp. TaxID=2053577 RepID=UPI0035636F56
MEKNFVKKEENVETFLFSFGSEEVRKAEMDVGKYVNQQYTIPGFRKGKVPLNIVRNFLAESFEEMVLEVLSDKIEEELKEEKILIPAVITDQKMEGEGARIEVKLHRDPEVKIFDYENLDLKIPKKDEVVLNYVNNRLEELRNEHAIVEPKEGQVENGDIVKIEYTITKDGKKIAENKVQELTVAPDDDRPIVKNVIGKTKGDVVEFDRTFEDSDNEYFYSVKILDVLSKSPLDLDDEFAKTVNAEANSLEELKRIVEKEGVESFLNWQKDFLRQQAMDKINDLVEIEISDSTLDYFVQRTIENSKKEKSYDNYLKQAGSEEKLLENFRSGVFDEIKKSRFIDEIASKEGFKAEQEEIEAYAEEMAPYWGISADRAREMVTSREDIKEDIVSTIIRNKVLDAVIERAAISEMEPSLEKEEKGSERSSGEDSSQQ